MTDAAALVRRMVDAHNDRDDRALLACYAPTAGVRFAGGSGPVEAATWVAALAGLRAGFPDLRYAVRSVGTGPGLAFVELTMTGTNAGPLQLGDVDRLVLRTDARSVPATARRMSVDGVVVLEAADGQVTSERHYWPDVDVLVQLGLANVPESPPSLAGATA